MKNQTTLQWSSEISTHDYEALYLANGFFGGVLDLTGTDMRLWASAIGSPNTTSPDASIQFPVTLMGTEVFYRNPHFKSKNFWISNASILCDDDRFIQDTAMPHKAQIYGSEQSLNLQEGFAQTRGTIYLGSYSTYKSETQPHRGIPFQSDVVFLKDSKKMSMKIVSQEDVDIAFGIGLKLEEHFHLKVSGNSICSIGNEIETKLTTQQTLLDTQFSEHGCIYHMRTEGAQYYSIHISSPNGKIHRIGNKDVLMAQGSLEIEIEVVLHADEQKQMPSSTLFFDHMKSEQEKRWSNFWKASHVNLPECEGVWRERYKANMYQVAQSMGEGPTHPVGLSQPMLPYWFGSFHDTDTYFCRPLLEAGHFHEAKNNFDFRHRTLPQAKAYAHALQRQGAMYPWQSDMNGCGQARNTPMNQAIIATEAWIQHLYHGTTESHTKAKEIVSEIFTNLCEYLNFEQQPVILGDIKITTFSETMESPKASETYLAMITVAKLYLESHQKTETNPNLHQLASRIVKELKIPSNQGEYDIVEGGDPEYIRTPSVTLGSFPLHELKADDVLQRTFEKELAKTINVFAWLPHQLSIVASQLENQQGPTSAYNILKSADMFYKTWHHFDEWENRRSARAKLFVTAAGGFCSAIHHMLIAETQADTYQVFPGIPSHWRDLSFDKLNTRHGWSVSAKMVDGQTSWIEVHKRLTSAKPFQLRISNPSTALRREWSDHLVHSDERQITISLS